MFLLADYGFDTYSTTIEATQETIDKQPGLVQRFVDASIIGWYNYLYGDNKAANELIKKDNPDMTDEQIAFSIEQMKDYGIVDSGDAREAGHRRHDGRAHARASTTRWSRPVVCPADSTIKKAYTLEFVNKGVGLDLQEIS